jgi:hypothetical protein
LRVEALKTNDDKTKAIKETLKTQFTKATDKELDLAADNILSIIQQFKIDQQTTDKDLETYAQVIADVYSEQWRNAKLM